MKRLLGIHLLLATFCVPLPAAINFTVSFTAQALNDLSTAEQALFTDGLTFWDDIIDGHQDNANRTWNLQVDTFSQPASGGGIVLGSAGPSSLIFSGIVPGSGLGSPGPNRYILSAGGNASFNINPAAGPLRATTIKHEIGHALGIGTLWEDNEVYSDGIAENSNRTAANGTPGQYIGANALAAYQAEFDAGATFIPVELDGGSGTAHGHWNETTDNFSSENAPGPDNDPGDSVAAPTDSFGNSLNDELLTGVLSGTGTAFLSETTKQSLVDIGFTLETVVPEPSSALLASLGLLLLGRRRR